MKFNLGLLLAPEIVNVLLNGLVFEAIENCVDGGRAEQKELNEINDDVDDGLMGFVVFCLQRELLTLPMETEDDDEKIIGTIEDDNRCN